MKRILNGKEVDMTNEEIAALEQSRKIVWDKDAYEQELNAAHDRWFEAIYLPLEYKSAEEITLWVNNPKYSTEASSLIALYWQSWDMLKSHIETVTEANADVEAFIQSLPNFEPAP